MLWGGDKINSIHEIKKNREMGERYMLFEELLENEYRAGKAEGKAEAILLLLNGHEQVQDSIKDKVRSITDETVLQRLLLAAANYVSMEVFVQELEKCN